VSPDDNEGVVFQLLKDGEIPFSMHFSLSDEHGEQKRRIAERLHSFFERFFSL